MKLEKIIPILLIVIILMYLKKDKENFEDDNLGWWKKGDKQWPD